MVQTPKHLTHFKKNKVFLHLPIQTLKENKKSKSKFLAVTPAKNQKTPTTIISQGDVQNSSLKNLALCNELIVDEFNLLPPINSFFDIIRPQLKGGLTPDQKKKLCTYAQIIVQAERQGINKPLLDTSLDKFFSQKFAIFHILIKSEDAHGNNILIQQGAENHLIPISRDFTRCLGYDPNNERMLPRTTRWEKWPALKEKVDPRLKKLLLSLDPLHLIDSLKINFFLKNHFDVDEDQKALIEIKFNHLKSNIIMVQESLRAELNIQQMLALILPAIDQEAFKFVTQGVLEGGALWPDRQRFVSIKTAFKSAWNSANSNQKYSMDIFQTIIKQEIQHILKIPANDLQNLYFSEMSYELRRGLYL